MANQTNTYNRAYRALMANAVACVLERYPDATAQRIHDLIYLAELECARHDHEPMLALRYEIWSRGPVQMDLYADLTDGPWLLKDAIHREGGRLVADVPYDPVMSQSRNGGWLEYAVRAYGAMSDGELHEVICGEGSLWREAASRKGLLTLFESGSACVSTEWLDLSEAIGDEDDREAYGTMYGLEREAQGQED